MVVLQPFVPLGNFGMVPDRFPPGPLTAWIWHSWVPQIGSRSSKVQNKLRCNPWGRSCQKKNKKLFFYSQLFPGLMVLHSILWANNYLQQYYEYHQCNLPPTFLGLHMETLQTYLATLPTELRDFEPVPRHYQGSLRIMTFFGGFPLSKKCAAWLARWFPEG